MLASTRSRALPWIGFVGDLLLQPLVEMPHEQIIDLLRDTFDVTAASYQWAERLNPATHRLSVGSREGIIIQPLDTLVPIAEEIAGWRRGENAGRHALVAWHLTVGGPLPFTTERVPTALVSLRERQPQLQMCARVGCGHQLAIHVRLGRTLYHCYVLHRSGTDFSDEDLALATQIQRLVIGLDRQVVLYHRLTSSGRDRAVDAGLTVREQTIVSLLAQGLTTQQIAHRLQCSPRTIHKHLERTYRKLGVRDRVNALRIAQQWNLAMAHPTHSGAPA